MKLKSKFLWPLLALAWTALVMTPAWWTMAKAERILSLAGLAGKIPQDCSRQILGAHVFILIMGLIGLVATCIAHNRGLAKRSRIQKGLAASEERFRGIFEHASVGIAQIAPNGRLMSFNQPFENLAGRSTRELKACKITELLIQSHQKPYQDLTLLTLEGKSNSFDLEVRFAAGNRAPVWGNLSQALIRKADGAPDYFVLVAQNITDRRLAEQKLFESEERFRVAFETCPDSVNINRLSDGMYVSINQGFTNILGFTEKDVAGKTSLELNIWNDPEDRKRLVEGLLKYGKVAGLEAKFKAKDGTLVDGLMSAALTNINGEPHLVNITSDIRNLKMADQKLKLQQKRIEAIMLANPDPVVVFGFDRRCTYMNPAFTRVFGWTPEDIYGRQLNYIPEEHEGHALKAIEQLKNSGTTEPAETQRLTKDGRLLDVLVSAAGIRDQNNEVTGLVVNLHDITRLKKVEARQRRLATAMEQAAEAVVITDLNGDILHVNPAFEKVTGYARKEVLGQNPRLLKSHVQDEKFYSDMWQTITSGGVWSGRLVNRKKNGEMFHEEATISPVRDSEGAIANFVAVKRDVSKEVHLEQRLRRSEKMEALGTLAGGIAHDFNNILGVITGYTELALENSVKESQMAKDLGQVLDAADRAKTLITQILTFSREVEPDLKPLDLNKVVGQSVSMMERTLPRMIDIRFQPKNSLPQIRGDFSQLEQVLLNLGTNARDAISGNGTLLLQTSEDFLDLDYCSMEKGLKPGRYVMLSVSDTGCGMDKKTLNRIFDPFFTTKETGKGTGLGLAMVFGIIKAHGGHLSCYSQPGLGTTFKLYFPALAQTDQAKPVQPPEEEELPTGNETIMLVDDEEMLRDMTARILSDRGFTVRQAESGEQGLELFAEAPEKIDLTILDLSMPGMGGLECLQRLLQLAPEAKVIVSSGYATNGTVSRILETGAAGFLAKPYTKSGLLNKARQVLDA